MNQFNGSENHLSHQIQPPFRFCPLCGGELDKKQIKAQEPDRLVCSRCSFVYYLDPKVAAVTVTLFEDRIVLVKRGISPCYGKWVIPGGFVDRGETLEETSLQVRIKSLLNVYSYPGQTVVIAAFLAEWEAGTPAACVETLEVCLFHYKEIPWPDLAFTSTKDALKDFGKHFIVSTT